MPDELIDLTTMKPSKASRAGFTPTDLMWIVVVGSVAYLAREAFRYFLSGRPTVVTSWRFSLNSLRLLAMPKPSR
jgi:hypothetical protein